MIGPISAVLSGLAAVYITKEGVEEVCEGLEDEEEYE